MFKDEESTLLGVTMEFCKNSGRKNREKREELTNIMQMHLVQYEEIHTNRDYLGEFFQTILGIPQALWILIYSFLTINDRDETTGKTALHYYLAEGYRNKNIVKLFIQGGADLNLKCNYGCPPLFHSIENGSRDITNLFIRAGADVNLPFLEGLTVLQMASMRNDANIAMKLIEAGADVNAQCESGATPLSWASCNGHIETMKILIDSGADVDLCLYGAKNQNALMQACMDGRPDAVNVLIKANANINIKDDEGNTALMLGIDIYHTDCVPLLRRAAKVVQNLINADVDINMRNNEGKSALMLAAKIKHTEIVRMLKKAGGKW